METIDDIRREEGTPEDPRGRKNAQITQHGFAVSPGARLLVTLLYALRARGKKRGVVSLCLGGGEAVALAVEAL